MSLFLNFDLYDIKTKNNDIIAPDEIISNYEYGFIKLTLYGKLILTNKNQIIPKKLPETIEEHYDTPIGTYGIIDSNKLIIKFDKPMFFISLCIKKNKNNFSDKPFNVYAEYNGRSFLIATEHNAEYNKWIKVDTIYALSNSIILPKGFDIDNLFIFYSSSYDDNTPKITQNKYSKIIQNSIKEEGINKIFQIIGLNNADDINEFQNLNNGNYNP